MFRDFLIVHSGVFPQDDGLFEFRAEGLEGSADDDARGDLVVDKRIFVGLGHAGVGVEGVASGTNHMQGGVGGNAVRPGGEFCARLEFADIAPNAREGVLQGVLGIMPVPGGG